MAEQRPHRSSRSKARSRALTVLFESEVRGLSLDGTLQQRLDDQDPPVAGYTVELVRGVVDHQEEIDELLSRYSRDWSLTRMPAVDRNALRLAVYEMRHTDVPDEVAIDEAVDLVTELSTDDSPAFVNGILGAILRDGTHRV
ncbi:transcription antitermination factor NusB [Nocardioides marmoribigeumensis]|uniref:Transcription antitermination protein NusB n=1 Tax=Nocardioides marmoribigeumensis TaxID=433649 RepID=A0ABU2BRW0_9ACTN|nr:transcription antitermination factor NusB [Nocardioides marmoribigeumensis]MDR7361001.1 N utilization substance protein B [Nocardioides marmoribigeumensis]